jgi:glycosyltransferase involved in cell wall biosynthesis
MKDSKKKIIIIGPAYPYRGGNSLFVSYVYDLLKDFFEVKVLNYKLLYPSFLFPGTTQFDKSGTVIKKVPNERILNSISPFSWIKTAAKIKNEKPDLIIFDWWHPFFSFAHFSVSQLLKKKFGEKILFITENVISHEGHFIDRTLTKLGLNNASFFLALSEKVEKDLKKIYPNKKVYRSELPVYECYSGDDISTEDAKLKLGFSPDDKVILFFGYVRKYKGLDILISAFKILLNEGYKLKLLIAGEFYDNPEPYHNQIKDLKLENEVKLFNQFIPNEEVKKYYLASDLVILPYRSATQSGILNVAYGFLKPVLVTDVGGLAEFVEDEKTGLIIKPESPYEIAEGVKKYLKLEEKVDFTGNIKALVKKNDFEKLPFVISEIIRETGI